MSRAAEGSSARFQAHAVGQRFKLPNVCAFTSKPALPVPVLGVLQPGQVPGMGKVHQQDELDDDEDEGAHHAKVIPDWEQTRSPITAQRRCPGPEQPRASLPALKLPSGMKKAPTVMPTSTRNLKNQNLRQQKGSEAAVRAFVRQGAAGLHGKRKPVLDGGSGVFAAAHSDHDDGEEEEEAGHGEAHAVHRLVAHDDVTVHLVLHAWYTGPAHTEAGNLDPGKHRRGKDGGPLLLGHSLMFTLIM